MNSVNRNDELFIEESVDSQPVLRLVFDTPETDNSALFNNELVDPYSSIKLFPDELDDSSDRLLDPDQPIIRLLPDNPSEEAVLRLRVQLLEVKLARQNAQLDFAERIDVDHLEWKRQKTLIQNLQVGNVLLTILSLALMIGACCMVVIR
jgi:hypothetical protein